MKLRAIRRGDMEQSLVSSSVTLDARMSVQYTSLILIHTDVPSRYTRLRVTFCSDPHKNKTLTMRSRRPNRSRRIGQRSKCTHRSHPAAHILRNSNRYIDGRASKSNAGKDNQRYCVLNLKQRRKQGEVLSTSGTALYTPPRAAYASARACGCDFNIASAAPSTGPLKQHQWLRAFHALLEWFLVRTRLVRCSRVCMCTGVGVYLIWRQRACVRVYLIWDV